MKTRNKIYTISGVFLALVICLAVFLVWPVFISIKNSSQELSMQKSGAISLKDKTDSLLDFQKNYESYKPNLDKIDQLFIDSKNPVGLIKFLEKISLEAGVQSEISLPPNAKLQSEGEDLTYINFQIKISGSFAKILEFAKKLENSPYLIEIRDASIKTIKASDKPEAFFTIKVFAR